MKPRLTWHIYGRGSLLEATLNGDTYSERFNDHTAKTDREKLRIEKNFRRRAEAYFHSLKPEPLPDWLRYRRPADKPKFDFPDWLTPKTIGELMLLPRDVTQSYDIEDLCISLWAASQAERKLSRSLKKDKP
jgi:hypothetical protein